LSFVQQISPYNESDALFGNYIGVQEPEKMLKIFKFDIPYKFHLRKVKTLSFVQQISPLNKPDALFGNYIGVRKPEKMLKILKFYILRVPPMQIPPKKDKNLEFCLANFTVNQFDGTFGNNFRVQEHKNKLLILKFNILRILPIQIPTKRG
jgi:hypothetical protein